jgi:hypothetical protein
MRNSLPNRLEATLARLSKLPAKKMPRYVPYPNLPNSRNLTLDQKWESMLWSIDAAQAHGKHALRGLAIALSHVIRAKVLESLLLDAREHRKQPCNSDELLWDEALPLNAAGETRESLLETSRRAVSVHLNDAIVLPEPWERLRLMNAFQNLGEKRGWGAWRQDQNHVGIAWKPWPIVWVVNGNHSTMTALVRGGGKFKCEETYDFKPVFDAVATDGKNWLRRDTGAVLAPVESMPMAGIFEIGRRL